MAYFGTTQASSLANPPRQLVAGIASPPLTTGLSTAPVSPGNQGGGLWFYTSTNATTDLTASNFFTDGKLLGMKPGDLVIGNQFSSAGSTIVTFQGSVVGVSTSGASLSTGSLITSTFT